jgi:hypothetical protein
LVGSFLFLVCSLAFSCDMAVYFKLIKSYLKYSKNHHCFLLHSNYEDNSRLYQYSGVMVNVPIQLSIDRNDK